MLRDALKNTKKIGLGQIVVRGQGSIVAIKPCGKGLLMETLRFADEVKKASTTFDDIPAKKSDKDLIDLAEELIEKKVGEFDPQKFKDSYTVALRELIEAKQEHRKPRAIEETPPASNVINLMDALKRSVKGGAANDDEPAARGRKAPAQRAKKPRAKTKARQACPQIARREEGRLMPARGGLAEYNRKRDFARTAEPKGERRKSGKQLSYLIQKHAARGGCTTISGWSGTAR